MKKVTGLLLSSVLILSLVPGVSAKDAVNFKIKPQFEYIEHYDYSFNTFHEGMAWVELQDGTMGAIDKTGKVIFTVDQEQLGMFDSYMYSEGAARVYLGSDNNNNQWAYLDKSGKTILQTKYDRVLNFKEGLAGVQKNKKWGFINRSGKEVIKPQYDEIRDDDGYGIDAGTAGFYEGLAAVSKNGKWGFIDKNGKEVIKIKYDWAFNFSEGLAVVSKNGKWGYINKSGKEVIKPAYHEAVNFSEGLALVLIEKNDSYHWYFINKSGKIVLNLKDKYDYISSFKEGVAVAKYYVNDPTEHYALLNKKGQVIKNLGKKYVSVKDFNEGIAEVLAQNGKYGFIDKNGKEVIKPIYSNVKGSSEGLIGVQLDEEYGFISNPLKASAK